MSRRNDTDARPVHTLLERKFERAVTPFQQFIADQTTSSVALIVCTVLGGWAQLPKTWRPMSRNSGSGAGSATKYKAT